MRTGENFLSVFIATSGRVYVTLGYLNTFVVEFGDIDPEIAKREFEEAFDGMGG